MGKMTAGDWKGDTARGARHAADARARYYDKLEKQRKKENRMVDWERRHHMAETEEAPVPTRDWTAYPDLDKFKFNELMESRTRLKDEIEHREARLKELNQELETILAVNDLSDAGVMWEGRSVKIVSRRGASKIVAEKLLANGVAANIIAASTEEGSPYTYLDVRKLGKKGKKNDNPIT